MHCRSEKSSISGLINHRKTGLTLAERPRDENGMEAFDDLFSSPEKDVTEARVNGANRRNDAESDEEQEMEIDEGMLRATQRLGCVPSRIY